MPDLAVLLDDLQANILKGHGRHHTRHLFLRLPAEHRECLRSTLAALPVMSARAQLEATEERRLSGTDGGPVVLLFLSASGYRALGVPDAQTPQDAAFRAGMAGRGASDDRSTWDDGYRTPIDAMLLVGAGSATEADAAASPLLARLTDAGAELVTEERGTALLRDHTGIEHFGFVDGRSQPLMLDDEVARELNTQGEPFVWDPAFGPLEIALVRDPGGATADSYGSYLVYRKLEQNVAAFKAAEDALADALELMGDARPLAGALVIGRFEDGTPVVASKRPLGARDVANNFGFSGDPDGSRCPFQAHVRKTNPRGETAALGATLAAERSHLMPRRGIAYGARSPDLNDRPAGGVGLLFMAYNRDIANQFEFTQHNWADNDDFLRTAVGPDPLIGRPPAHHEWPSAWDNPDAGKTRFDIDSFVTMKGGEYFFAPSRSFFGNLTACSE